MRKCHIHSHYIVLLCITVCVGYSGGVKAMICTAYTNTHKAELLPRRTGVTDYSASTLDGVHAKREFFLLPVSAFVTAPPTPAHFRFGTHRAFAAEMKQFLYGICVYRSENVRTHCLHIRT